MSKPPSKDNHKEVLRNETFLRFCHPLFLSNASGVQVHRNSVSPDLGIEYNWVKKNVVLLSMWWKHGPPSDNEESASPARHPARGLRFSTGTSQSSKSSSTRTPKSNDEDDRKPAAEEPAKKTRVPVETVDESSEDEDDDEDDAPDENPHEKPKDDSAKLSEQAANVLEPKYNSAELSEMSANLLGSPEFRKVLKKYCSNSEPEEPPPLRPRAPTPLPDDVDPVETAQASAPAQAAGSVPRPGLQQSFQELLEAMRGTGRPGFHEMFAPPSSGGHSMASRSRANAKKVKDAEIQCRQDAQDDLEYMVHDFSRKGRDPTDRKLLVGLARRYYLDQDRRRHPKKIEIVQECLGMMLLEYFGNPHGFSELELEFIQQPPCKGDELIPRYATRSAKGGRRNQDSAKKSDGNKKRRRKGPK